MLHAPCLGPGSLRTPICMSPLLCLLQRACAAVWRPVSPLTTVTSRETDVSCQRLPPQRLGGLAVHWRRTLDSLCWGGDLSQILKTVSVCAHAFLRSLGTDRVSKALPYSGGESPRSRRLLGAPRARPRTLQDRVHCVLWGRFTPAALSPSAPRVGR